MHSDELTNPILQKYEQPKASRKIRKIFYVIESMEKVENVDKSKSDYIVMILAS